MQRANRFYSLYFRANIYMKRVVCFIILSLWFTLSFAQQRTAGPFISFGNQAKGSNNRNIIDTVYPLSFVPVSDGGLGCFTGVYTAPVAGYVSGNNQFRDREKAQYFDMS